MSYSDEIEDAPPAKSQVPLWIVLALGVVFILAWVLFLRPQISLKKATEAPGVGKPLVALDLEPLTNTMEGLTLDDVKGKVTLINYWGTWCPPCVLEFPHMVELWDRFRDKPDFKFVSVSSTFNMPEDFESVRQETVQFLKSRSVALPTYIDVNGASRQVLQSVIGQLSLGYPTTVLLDRDGIIRAVWIGYHSGDEHQMESLVAKLLSEKAEEKAQPAAAVAQ